MCEEKVSMSTQEKMDRLAEVLHSDYVWPEIPQGWQLEFIVHPDHSLEMDFLHPVSCRFWSDDNEFVGLPMLKNGCQIGLKDLVEAGVQYSSSFGFAKVSQPQKPKFFKPV